jgi:hypothetical protein
MYIGIMTDSPDMDGKIPALFAEANFLLIVDADAGTVHAKYTRNGMADSGFARKLIEHDCEAVLCGYIEREPFLIIADEGCITRYNCVGLSAGDALKEMLNDKLPLIVDFIGGTGCHSVHTACDGGHGVKA